METENRETNKDTIKVKAKAAQACPTLCDPMDYDPVELPRSESNPGLRHWIHCRWILHQLSHKGSTRILKGVDYPSWVRNRTGVSYIAGRFFTN